MMWEVSSALFADVICVLEKGLEYSGLVGVSKMLQMNKKLQKLILDENGIDLAGLKVENFSLLRLEIV
jgi:hypothetical protein